MNIDIALDQSKGYFDISFEGEQIKATEGYDTAIAVSLFSDQRATESEQPDPLKRRGWIGDLGEIDQIGSKLWFLGQSRLTTNTLNRVIDFTQKALAWLVKDSLAKKINVTGRLEPDTIIANVIITTPDNKNVNFSVDIWRQTIDQFS